jgi:3-oxoacyl-[acyl-carrier protein] reductase
LSQVWKLQRIDCAEATWAVSFWGAGDDWGTAFHCGLCAPEALTQRVQSLTVASVLMLFLTQISRRRDARQEVYSWKQTPAPAEWVRICSFAYNTYGCQVSIKPSMKISLENQVAVVTGGSRGIGAATVMLFAKAGCNVVFSYLRASNAAQEIVHACRKMPGSVQAVRADVSKMADASKLIDAAIRRFRRLDILVANAGFWNADPKRVHEITEREWDKMVAVNLKGVYSVIRCAVPHMISQNRGRIIAVSSTAGQRGEAFHAHYAAAKGGVISLVKGLATELAPHNILVNAVAPGWVDTDMAKPVVNKPTEMRKATSEIPLRRFARPEEVAMPILFLASDMSTYMTGEIININGGSVLCG